MSQAINFLTPIGRFVQGDLFKGRETDMEGKPLVIKSGPNAGQPRKDYFVALAIPKSDPGFNELWAKLDQAAKAGYPEFFDAQGQCTNPNFAWKYVDGDSQTPDKKLIKPCDRPGFAGHHILRFSSGFPFPVYGTDIKEEITDPSLVKRGYYIRIAGSVVDNRPSQTPGIYLNINGVQFCGYGEEIRTGLSGEDMFGSSPINQLPPGASATPPAPENAPPTGASDPGTQPNNPPGSVPGAVSGAPNASPVGGAGVQPVPGFVAPPSNTTQETKHNVNGTVYTRSQLIGFGWTEAQINATPLA